MEGEVNVNKMVKKEKRIVVAVDESEESMHALSWCLTHLIPADELSSGNSTLVLLYVKPPPPVFSFFDAAGNHHRPLKYTPLSFFPNCPAMLFLVPSKGSSFMKRV